jgi:hypothetical protein
VGSIGQALSPLLVTVYVSHFGWTRLFDLFVLLALVSGVISASGIRLETSLTSQPNRSTLESSNLSV